MVEFCDEATKNIDEVKAYLGVLCLFALLKFF